MYFRFSCFGVLDKGNIAIVLLNVRDSHVSLMMQDSKIDAFYGRRDPCKHRGSLILVVFPLCITSTWQKLCSVIYGWKRNEYWRIFEITSTAQIASTLGNGWSRWQHVIVGVLTFDQHWLVQHLNFNGWSTVVSPTLALQLRIRFFSTTGTNDGPTHAFRQ